MNHFERLLDDLAQSADRRDYFRDIAATAERSAASGARNSEHLAKSISTLGTMAKAMLPRVRQIAAQRREDDRQVARQTFESLVARANEAAAAARLTGEQAARIDNAIANIGARVSRL